MTIQRLMILMLVGGLMWLGLLIGGVALLAPKVVEFKPTKLCQRVCDSFVSEDVSAVGLADRDGQCYCRITPDL